MPAGVAGATLVVVGVVVFFGGFVKGVAGFGYAIAGTALLASFLSPTRAVVIMILPMLVANVALLRELDREGLSACARRFWPFVAAALVGTLVGMALLDRIPTPVLALGLGLLTALYVLAKQSVVALPGEAWLRDRCFRPGTAAKATLGLVSGVVFGATNVAVQIVAYLDSLDLGRSTFVGVLAMVLVGVATVRVAAAWYLGLYAAGGVLVLSVVAVLPGLAGVAAGSRIREHVPESYQTAGTLVLLGIIAVRLTTKGLSGL